MALKRMDNVRIVVEDLAATIDFFRELGLELEGAPRSKGNGLGVVHYSRKAIIGSTAAARRAGR
jgi:catechol 2,3-dioxygenase-like lactoylglutathione lyase family enzyme